VYKWGLVLENAFWLSAAQHFTEDFIKFLLPGLKIRTVTFLDKDAVKEAFKSEVKSDHVVKILLEDGRLR